MAILTTNWQCLGQKYIGTSGGNLYVRLYARYSEQDIANNRSYVYYQARSYYENSTYIQDGQGTIGVSGTGASYKSGACTRPTTGETVSVETSGWVYHNDEGYASVTGNASIDFPNWGWSGTATASADLPRIPRASSISVANYDLGQNPNIVIGKKVDSFTSTLSYKIGTRTGVIAEKISDPNKVWEMSSTLISQIKMDNPKNHIVETIVYCDTYNGNTKIGSTQEAKFKLFIVDKPIVTDVIREELISSIANKTTAVLRSISKNNFTITATAPEGTTIMAYRVKNGNQDSGISTVNVVRMNDIQNYYEVNGSLKTKFIITCIDARGNESDGYSLECDFINYIHVSLNKTDVKITRTNATTNDAKITLAGNFYNGLIGTIQNIISLKFKYRKQGTETWSNLMAVKATYDGNKFKTDNLSIPGDFDYQENWEFMFYASDVLNDTDEYLYTFISSIPFVKWHKNGAWIKEIDTNKLMVNGNQVLNNVKTLRMQLTGEQTLEAETTAQVLFDDKEIVEGVISFDDGIQINDDFIKAVFVSARVRVSSKVSYLYVYIFLNDKSIASFNACNSSMSSINSVVSVKKGDKITIKTYSSEKTNLMGNSSGGWVGAEFTFIG